MLHAKSGDVFGEAKQLGWMIRNEKMDDILGAVFFESKETIYVQRSKEKSRIWSLPLLFV